MLDCIVKSTTTSIYDNLKLLYRREWRLQRAEVDEKGEDLAIIGKLEWYGEIFTFEQIDDLL